MRHKNKGFTFRRHTERRTVAVRLALLLTLLASCPALAPAAPAQIWRSDLKVADMALGTKGCGMGSHGVSCSTLLSNQSFRFDGRTYQVDTVVLYPSTAFGGFGIAMTPDAYELMAEPWKVCVNSTAFSLALQRDTGRARDAVFSRIMPGGLEWHHKHGLTWETGDSVRLTITSGSCP